MRHRAATEEYSTFVELDFEWLVRDEGRQRSIDMETGRRCFSSRFESGRVPRDKPFVHTVLLLEGQADQGVILHHHSVHLSEPDFNAGIGPELRYGYQRIVDLGEDAHATNRRPNTLAVLVVADDGEVANTSGLVHDTIDALECVVTWSQIHQIIGTAVDMEAGPTVNDQQQLMVLSRTCIKMPSPLQSRALGSQHSEAMVLDLWHRVEGDG